MKVINILQNTLWVTCLLSSLNLTAAVDNNYYATRINMAITNGDQSGAREDWRKLEGTAKNPTIRGVLGSFEEAGWDLTQLPARWSDLQTADQIANAALKVYADHAESVAGALARETNNEKLARIEAATQATS